MDGDEEVTELIWMAMVGGYGVDLDGDGWMVAGRLASVS